MRSGSSDSPHGARPGQRLSARIGDGGPVVDAFEPWIRESLRAYPTMPSMVITERIGWLFSIRALSGRVVQWRSARARFWSGARSRTQGAASAVVIMWSG